MLACRPIGAPAESGLRIEEVPVKEGGAARREPLTGNMGEDLGPYKPVHETAADS
jgi:hypothetical protein